MRPSSTPVQRLSTRLCTLWVTWRLFALPGPGYPQGVQRGGQARAFSRVSRVSRVFSAFVFPLERAQSC
jgi:hypothetical protein